MINIQDPEKVIDQLLKSLTPENNREVIEKAIRLAERLHTGQKRKEGTPQILHPVRVSLRLAEAGYGTDEVICIGLLHDVLEDCSDISPQDIEREFGSKVSLAVSVLSKKSADVKLTEEEYFQRLEKASNQIKTVKIFDRIDNLESLNLIDDIAKKHEYIDETKKFFFDLARFNPALLAELKSAVLQVKI